MASDVLAAGGRRSISVSASATVLQPASVALVQNFSAGATKTKGSNPTGTVIVPATYPLFGSPAPGYPDTQPQGGANAVAPAAARIDLTGQPNAAFTLNVQGWTQVAGTAGATMALASNTYYSPTNAPTNAPRGVFNAQGKATIYVGGTIVLARDPSGSTVTMKPTFTITYN
ncbi:DUF4402 domain-containing protein [Caulobacter sp. KR2-114]|uniref:DUF4402 domain-containing protein n=1 Tax=Caulobacter sp. KR2-114 TaxID=3400912 RepID=UPI003BFF0F6B